jgi:cell wall-associated NlpC family hydrolase
MFVHKTIGAIVAASALSLLSLPCAFADEAGDASAPSQLQVATSLTPAPADAPAVDASATLLQRTSKSIKAMLSDALELVGIRYRRGGNSPETGFDCSGFVSHVFREGIGLHLPHSAQEMSEAGSPVAREDLKPGDLVFFDTVRKTISHVGIYLGDNLFVHAPRPGAKVRVDSIVSRYWHSHFRAARRFTIDE